MLALARPHVHSLTFTFTYAQARAFTVHAGRTGRGCEEESATATDESKGLEPEVEEEQQRFFPANINWSAPEVLSASAGIDVRYIARDPQNQGNESHSSHGNAIRVGASADIWSLAMVIAEVFTGAVPFDDPEWRRLSLEDFLGSLFEGRRPQLPRHVHKEYPWLVEMIRKAWYFDATQRCDSIEMVNEFESHEI